ncbi:MAG: hypothetical protein JKY52_00290 [Flavobacteriales bacterium]|nr:hypothetical protein [Flavobacteriales bacterium]
MAFQGGGLNPLLQALQQRQQVQGGQVPQPPVIQTGPDRSQLVAQLLQQQQAQQPRNIGSIGEGLARLGSRLVDTAAGKSRIDKQVSAQETQQQAIAQALQGAFAGDEGALGQVAQFNPQLAAQLKAQQLAQKARSDAAQATPASQAAFKALTAGLSEEEVTEAQKIRLGLSPRAVGAAAKTFDIGGVPHVFDPVTQEVVPVEVGGADITSKEVGVSRAEIAEAKKRGEGKGTLAGKTIDKGFTAIGKIRANLFNIDRAIAALDKGADTGAVSRFLPSVRASTVELNQIQNELALDVVGATTFGALSAGELALARETALPTGLSPAALKEFLVNKKTAQTKLSNYFQQQIEFLEDGGTVVEFLRQQGGGAEAPTDLSQLTDEELLKRLNQ